MGYLDKATITVDAILTNRGRELLAKGGIGDSPSSFSIVKFAVADDEIDYGLYNVNALNSLPGYIIENMPILEATPDEQQIMRYKLTTLQPDASGQVFIPMISKIDDISIASSDSAFKTVTIQTTIDTADASNTTPSESYVVQISNAKLVEIYKGANGTAPRVTESEINANGSITLTVGSTSPQLAFKRITGKTGTATVTVFGQTTGATASFKIAVS